jgi:hypothetical protein
MPVTTKSIITESPSTRNPNSKLTSPMLNHVTAHTTGTVVVASFSAATTAGAAVSPSARATGPTGVDAAGAAAPSTPA